MKKTYDLSKLPFDKGPKLIIGLIALIFLATVVNASLQTIGAGERGVVFSKFGGVKPIRI